MTNTNCTADLAKNDNDGLDGCACTAGSYALAMALGEMSDDSKCTGSYHPTAMGYGAMAVAS